MSTRAQIKLKKKEDGIYIYKHSDGYPSQVIPLLKPYVDHFFKERGYDAIYLLCQIVRQFAIRDFKNDQSSKIGSLKNSPYGAENGVLGWGLDRQEHGDIEYLYEIDDKGQIHINGKKLTNENYDEFMSE